MTFKEAKTHIDRTGEAFLTLWNDQGEWAFVGQVDKMTAKDGRVKLVWKLPSGQHTSAYTHAAISGAKTVYHRENINPLRLDAGIKKYEVTWDV